VRLATGARNAVVVLVAGRTILRVISFIW
jgi:hypothetical protein